MNNNKDCRVGQLTKVYVEWKYKCKYTRADTWREEGLKIRGLCANRVHTEGALGLMGFGRLFFSG